MQNFDGANNAGTAESIIKDTDMSTFMADVIEKSVAVPVLVSFYSQWSENCKKLTPIIEKFIHQAAGAVHMVRIDFEKNQQLAAQMKIQSVPTVVVFANQRPVDAFAGVKSEAEVKEFISRFAPDMQLSPLEEMIEHAILLLDEKNYQEAAGLYSQILQHEADNILAIAGLSQCLIKLNDLDNAEAVLGSTPKTEQNHAIILGARAALDVARQISELEDASVLEKAIEKDQNNHQARFDLSLIAWAKGEQDKASDYLLDIVARDRGWHEDGARKQLVKFFEIAGPADPFTIKTRRKLSSILFS
ncbi:MAG: tetratricopeptide repeat protein [Emcibacter sp.]|nr:tetratricopeptide repeat protein [Emcibacter sp.]